MVERGAATSKSAGKPHVADGHLTIWDATPLIKAAVFEGGGAFFVSPMKIVS